MDRNGFLLVCLQDEHLMIDNHNHKNKNKPMSNSEGEKREEREER